MAFEPLQQEAIDGLASYPAQASVDDRQVRGTIEGMRTESITYVAERAGTYELPAIRINWWNIGTESLEQIELEGMRLSVKAAPHGKLSGLSSKGARGWITVAAVILVLLLLFMFRHQLLELWRRMADARAESESRYFRALQSSVRRGNTLPIFRDLMRWIDRIDTDNQPATLEDFANKYCDTAGQQVMMQLQQSFLDDDAVISYKQELMGALRSARRRARQQTQQKTTAAIQLPPLNPNR